MKVVGVPDVGTALRVLNLAVEECRPMFRVHRTEPGRPALGVV
jgi:hypothetical protein